MSGQLIAETRPVARKPHRCENCRHIIPPGVRYLRQFCVDGGDSWTWITHQDCHEAALFQFKEDGGGWGDDLSPLYEYESLTGYFPDWLRGRWPHVVCRLEFWKQIRGRA